ncbi:MAG: GHKL domain-containing protein [Clostridium sp.]|uniref:sensor histidine kinase n=2 Tax=Clostridium sp. TaxID=1506 RepID=UPI0025C036BF|nr:GHKL domain-containing protein [Clostridium sp.]MCH3963668.1 GHKL domain-containing protein [Clostridium sp.]MCI1714809.1 GHKL domain-containing protein [Clostridium sp.]MCI1799002.1 GHKL domain-containing protein [Clostridium sp.]MCI1812992.1 GHKL domain-containing protein [Clostridium sp.]MCI1869882.1 GHKL domain-containing protein [Clostridium sp.]
MEPLQEFISTFFELTAFMILWSKFNLRRKLNFSIFCKNFVIVVLISIVVVISNDMFGSYYSIAVNYLFMTFLSSFVYKKNIVKNFVQVCTSIMFLMIIELIVMYPLKLIGFDTDTFLFGIVANTFVWIFCIIIYYFIPNSKFEVISKIDYTIVNYILINLILYVIIYKVLWEYDSKLLLNNSVIFICILMIIFILNLFLCYHIVKINEKNKAMEVNSRYIPIIKSMTEDIRRKQHEFKNHLNAIGGLVQVSEGKELKYNLLKYIKSVNCSTEGIEKIAYIDNLILRAVIYSKSSEAEIRGIKFKYNVSNELNEWKVEDYELSEILANILNNAFEAVEDNSNRSVVLNIYKNFDKNVIELKNTVENIDEDNLKKVFKRGFSTKKGENRGYGLYNAKKIVESKEGKIQLSLEDNLICFVILL